MISKLPTISDFPKQVSIRKITNPSKIQVKQIMEIQNRCRLSHWSEKDYFEEAADKRSILLIAEYNLQVLGFMIVRTSIETSDLLNFGVLPDFQGKGIGEKMFINLSQEILKLNSRQIWLEVRKSNTNAIKFYTRKGFQIMQTRRNFYSNPNEDALLMMRETGQQITPKN